MNKLVYYLLILRISAAVASRRVPGGRESGPRKKMDLSDLLIFKTVAEEGGILRAARKLHRVQSNVTTRIKQLETSIGAELFFRERQRLVLSPRGEKLLTYADQLLRLA